MLVKELAKLGLGWWDLSQTSAGVDGIVLGHGWLRPAEIKDPAQLTKACKAYPYLALTEHEKKVHQMLKGYGIRVEILTDVSSLDVFRQPQFTGEKWYQI